MRLDGAAAVVSGGASGIGRETASALARAGARVFIARRCGIFRLLERSRWGPR